ncbi:MAG TPA: type II secretion system secretin GspD, partial [Kofleriaceae bacterium]|nr:type II secretion system secretin GspD [Kofleriaceae bacterium]
MPLPTVVTRAVLILTMTTWVAAARAQTDDAADTDDVLYSCGKPRDRVVISFKPDVELKELVSWAMGFTCKNFVYGSSVGSRSAKATIIVPNRMTAEQAWRVFLVALETMGLGVVPKGDILQVMESAQVKGGPLPLYLRSRPRSRDQVVRKLFETTHVDAAVLARALEQLKSKQGDVVQLEGLDLVLVTDYATHITRMTELLAEVDRPRADETLFAIAIHRVDAVELARTLEQLLDQAPAAATARPTGKGASAPTPRLVPSKIVADARTRTLLVVATRPAYDRVKAIVDRLDRAVDGEASGSMHLYRLRNADAESLAQTLQTLIGGAPTAPASGRPAPATDAAATLHGQVRVAFDKPTNALLVIASMRDYLVLSQIIRELDEPRRQVYIEAMVFEVSAEVGRQLGLSFHGSTTSDGNVFVGGLQHETLASVAAASLATASGLVAGGFGVPIVGSSELFGVSLPSFGVMLQAFANRNTLDVLSSPHVLTADNETATVSVGENIPYQARVSQVPAGTDASSFFTGTSIERQNVALTLEITPHISSDELIRVEIKFEKSDVVENKASGLGPTWSTSTLTNTVIVHDQETIVIGGLMSDKLEQSHSTVPILGDIPVLGHLFRSSKKYKRKRNLLILLTPHIVANQGDARRILELRTRERKEFVAGLETFERA